MRDRYGPTFDRVLSALSAGDLIDPWWNESWADPAYLAPEAAALLERIDECRSVADVIRLLRDVFDQSTFAGVLTPTPDEWRLAAARIWAIDELH